MKTKASRIAHSGVAKRDPDLLEDTGHELVKETGRIRGELMQD